MFCYGRAALMNPISAKETHIWTLTQWQITKISPASVQLILVSSKLNGSVGSHLV